MSAIPNAGRNGTQLVTALNPSELFVIPEDASNCTVRIQNLSTLGYLYVRVGATETDRVDATEEYGYRIDPMAMEEIVQPRAGRVLAIAGYTPTGRNVAFDARWRAAEGTR